MQYNTLGRTGLRISRLSLGTMTFGDGTGMWESIAGVDRKTAVDLIAAAIDHGVNLVDTADAYSEGQSEVLLGHALSKLGVDETRMLVATKVRLRTGTGQNDVGLGRSHIMRSVETSLRRLKRDHIDLFQLHDRDALVPLDETLRVLDDLVTQGKVRHIGACNFSAADLERAAGICTHSDRVRFASNQVYYSLAARDIEHEIVPIALANSVGLIIWGPLAGGYLSGKYSQRKDESSVTAPGRRTNLNFPPIDPAKAAPIVGALHNIAETVGAQPAQVALAWTQGRAGISSVTIGARSTEQLLANLGSVDLALPCELTQQLTDISAPDKPYPYWMQSLHDTDRLVP